jgi:outer membrane protein assembly factor BamB
MRSSLFLILLMAVNARGADWRSFRGVESATVAEQPVPISWSDEENIAWKVDLPGRGLSGPIVVQNRVFVTCCSGGQQERLHVLCFDAATSDLLWERQFWATGRTSSHPKTCNAAPTPTSDGARVFAFFSSNDLVCLDLDGNMQWCRGLTFDYPNASNSLGMASSPIVSGETVIAMVETDAESFTTGINVKTGEERWRIDRPRMANWTSPTLWKAADGEELVLIQSGKGLVAVDPLTGTRRWSYDDGASTVASTAVVGGVAYVPSHGITAVRRDASTQYGAEVLWREGSLNPGTASPLVFGDKVLVINNAGVLVCADASTGKRQWQLRLSGAFSGSPVIAGHHLFVFNEEGVGFAIDLNGKGNIVSQHDFKDTLLCTPAVADGALYVRSDSRLWKIAEK